MIKQIFLSSAIAILMGAPAANAALILSSQDQFTSVSHPKDKEKPAYASDSLLVKLKRADHNLRSPDKSRALVKASTVLNKTSPQLSRLLDQKQTKVRTNVDMDRWMKVAETKEDPVKLCKQIMATGEAESCQPNYVMTVAVLPNDTYVDGNQDGQWSRGAWGQPYDDLWGLREINAVNAWAAPGCANNCKGEGVVVAVLDTGLDATHADIQGNIFVNPNEVPNDQIDNDNNGYVDDVSGYDFLNDDANPDDDHGHGTHVAGTIAAVAGNGIGIAGVAPRAKILPLKGLGLNGGASDILAEAIRYAADMGVQVINNSWGCYAACPSNPIVEDAVRYAYARGVVVVFAAGNANADTAYFSPQNMDQEVITVAATDRFGQRSYFSNYGATVDLAAPGGGDLDASGYQPARSILSLRAQHAVGVSGLTVGSGYLRQAGTSMASPHAAGAAALLKGKQPNLTPLNLRNLMQNMTAGFGVASSVPIGTGILRALNDGAPRLPMIGLISYQKTTSSYIVPQTEWELSVRLIFSGLQAPFNGTLSTTRSDMQITTGTVQFTQEGTTPYAANAATKFRIRYTGTDSTFYGSVPFMLRIDGTGSSFLFTYSLGIEALDSWAPSNQLYSYVAPTLADVDRDGTQEIIISYDNYIYDQHKIGAFYTNGSMVPGWPVSTGANQGYAPSVADIDGDGSPEIFAGTMDDGTDHSAWARGKVFGWRANGTPIPGWPVETGGAVVTAPAFIDFNGDGRMEVVAPSQTHTANGYLSKVHTWSANGIPVTGWPVMIPDELLETSLALGDLDGDGNPEIIAGSHHGRVHVWHDDGTVAAGWPRQTGGNFHASPALADLDGDGGLEVIASAYGSSPNAQVYIWSYDGRLVSGWPKTVTGCYDSSPVVADLDLDGAYEIILSCQNGTTHMWHVNGSSVPGWPRSVSSIGSGAAAGEGEAGSADVPIEPAELIGTENSSAVADLDGDGHAEVIATYAISYLASKMCAWRFDGSVFPGFPIDPGYWATSPVIGDLDQNGTLEIVAIPQAEPPRVWTLPYAVRASDRKPWASERHDPQRSGLYRATPGFAAPNHLIPKAVSATRVELTWQDNSTEDDGFRIERSPNGTTFTQIAQVGRSVTTYADNGLTTGSTYYYRVKAFQGLEESGYSPVESVRLVAPQAATNLTGTGISASRINLSWQDNADSESGFQIFRGSTAANLTYLGEVGRNVTNFQDRNLPQRTSFFYYVKAYNGIGTSSPSNTISVTTAGPPAAPSNLRINTGATIAGYLYYGILQWQDNSSDETGFITERRIENGNFEQIGMGLTPNNPRLDDSALLHGTRYDYRVRAYNDYGYSAYSDIVSIVTPGTTNLPPTLSPIGDQTVVVGNALTFTVSGQDPNSIDALIYTASNLPTGAVFNSTTRVFSWTPSASRIGTYSGVQFSVSDRALKAIETITITVRSANMPPVINSRAPPDSAVSIDEGDSLVFSVNAADPEGNALSYVWQMDQVTVSGASASQYTYAPDRNASGTHALSVQISDGTQTVSSVWNIAVADTIIPAVVSNRKIFYNDSMFDGRNPGANSADDGAVAPDKQALLPGQTASHLNYTSYTKGINGVMFDIARAGNAPAINASDIEIRIGNDNNPLAWPLGPAPGVSKRDLGSNVTRVTLIWPEGSVKKAWMRITVKATANTGLTEPSVFYFGNAVGESLNDIDDTPTTFVNAADEIGARVNPRTPLNPAPIDFRWDYNRDGSVNAADQLAARTNPATPLSCIRLIQAPYED